MTVLPDTDSQATAQTTAHTASDALLPGTGDLPAISDPGAPTIRVSLDLPAATAVTLKHRTNGALDIAETIALVVQLYAGAPLDRGAVTLTTEEYGRVCAVLGFSPRTTTELVGAIESLVSISFGGVRVKFTAEEVELINARNASELPPREWAEQIMRIGFEAWKNGTIG